jgi:hypothetical protein
MLNEHTSAFVIPAEFTCNIITESALIPNAYSVRIGVDPGSDNPELSSLGFRKIKFLFEEFLQNSIIINQEHPAFETINKLDNNAVVLPCEPFDFYIGSILLLKVMAIAEKYLDINYISISSVVGESIEFNVFDPYLSDLDLDGDHWWNADNLSTGGKSVFTWDELKLTDTPGFKPVVVKGGLSDK